MQELPGQTGGQGQQMQVAQIYNALVYDANKTLLWEKSWSVQEYGFELYKKSADLGDLVANYWVGVLYHRGQGVEKDVKTAIKYLEAARDKGNCQADYELFDIYAREESFEDYPKAYGYFLDAIENGFTSFQELQDFFKKNIKELTPVFLKRKHSEELKLDSDEEIINLHDAMVNELMK